jgi:hypothetical protein
MDYNWCSTAGLTKDILVEANFNNVEGYNKVLQNDAKSIDLIEVFELQAECLTAVLKFQTVTDRTIREQIRAPYRQYISR